MQLPPTNVLIAVIVNVTVFLLSLFFTLFVFAALGWRPRDKSKPFNIVEIFLLIILLTLIMTVVCFRCSVVVDGLVAGVVLAVLLNVGYEIKNRLQKSK